MEQTLQWSLAPKRDDHIPRAANHASATVGSPAGSLQAPTKGARV